MHPRSSFLVIRQLLRTVRSWTIPLSEGRGTLDGVSESADGPLDDPASASLMTPPLSAAWTVTEAAAALDGATNRTITRTTTPTLTKNQNSTMQK